MARCGQEAELQLLPGLSPVNPFHFLEFFPPWLIPAAALPGALLYAFPSGLLGGPPGAHTRRHLKLLGVTGGCQAALTCSRQHLVGLSHASLYHLFRPPQPQATSASQALGAESWLSELGVSAGAQVPWAGVKSLWGPPHGPASAHPHPPYCCIGNSENPILDLF